MKDGETGRKHSSRGRRFHYGKLLSVFVVVILALSLVGCRTNKDPKTTGIPHRVAEMPKDVIIAPDFTLQDQTGSAYAFRLQGKIVSDVLRLGVHLV